MMQRGNRALRKGLQFSHLMVHVMPQWVLEVLGWSVGTFCCCHSCQGVLWTLTENADCLGRGGCSEDAEQRTTSCPSIWKLPFFQSKVTFLGCLKITFPGFLCTNVWPHVWVLDKGIWVATLSFYFWTEPLGLQKQFPRSALVKPELFSPSKNHPSLNFVDRVWKLRVEKDDIRQVLSPTWRPGWGNNELLWSQGSSSSVWWLV